jgi:hypothetical protein
MSTLNRAVRALVGAGGLTVVLSSCGQATREDASAVVSDSAQATPTTAATSTPPSPSATPSSAPVQDCGQLLANGWRAPTDDEPDISWDPETGVAYISFGPDTEIVVNVLTDSQCALVPGLATIIPSMIAGAEKDRATECAAAVRQILSGKGEIHGMPVDLEKVRQHVLAWCLRTSGAANRALVRDPSRRRARRPRAWF